MESTREARRAGRKHANAAAASISKVAANVLKGSTGLTPNRLLAISRAAASERPEEIGVRTGAGAHHLAGRSHHLGGLEIVYGHAVLAAEPAEAAAKCQPCNAGSGVDAHRRGEAVGLGGGVEVRERGAALDGDAAGARVDARGLHLRKVDHDTIVAQGVAGDVVSAAADGEHDPAVPRQNHCVDDVRRGGAANDHARALIDRRVSDLTRAFVSIVARKKGFSPQAVFQLLDFPGAAKPQPKKSHRSGAEYAES